MSSYARVDMEGKSFFNERGNVHPHQAHHPFSIEPLKLRPKQQEQAPQQETFTEVSSTVLGSQNGKDPPLSPSPSGQRDIGSPGLESVASDDKEVYDGKERAPQNPPAPPPKRRICGLPKKWFLLVTGLAVCIIVALAVALGVVFGTRDSSSDSSASTETSTSPPRPTATGPSSDSVDPDYSIGGALDSQYYSVEGAFNGSGIALARVSFDENDRGLVDMYFQHWTGDLRWSQLMSDGSWQGGSSSETLTEDARNGTPIAAVAYATEEQAIWHIFYIDLNNTLREKINSNTTNVWREGPLTKKNLKANQADRVALQACWFSNSFGDDTFQENNVQNVVGGTPIGDIGIRLWYGRSDTTLEQLGWLYGEDEWVDQGTWQGKNSRAGVGCYSWGSGSVTYVFMVNLENTLEIWWRDTNSSLVPTFAHPINEWTNTSIAIPDVHPSASMGYTNYLYAQKDNYTIQGFNVSWDAENTTFVPNDNFIIPGGNAVGLPGTHLSVTTLDHASGGDDLYVFYQTEGDDISVFTRDLVAGPWAAASVDIPDS